MIETRGYATHDANAKFVPFNFERRNLGDHDILIDVQFCGICHSDIHQAKQEWGPSIYPMVPGHEIVGRVSKAGNAVTKFKVGDLAGVGCFVDSCRKCSACEADQEQFCKVHCAATYNGTEMDEKTPTYGGYSKHHVVDEAYGLKVSPDQPLAAVAPLLCAGITTYSPLKHYKIGPGSKVAVVGLGGLGHMGVKLAVSMGAEVTVLSTSPSKKADALKLGAHHFVVTSDKANLKPLARTFNFILDCVSADHEMDMYLKLLDVYGAMVLVGLPENPISAKAFSLAGNNRTLAGSSIGGIKETQEMLDYCAQNNITSDVEVIPITKIEEAYDRTIRADVRYRFVIDMATLK
ncbi:MAG: NAD(P)-dependent alcohol dehydrogenase [Pyrinomonadaceae bacterium]